MNAIKYIATGITAIALVCSVIFVRTEFLYRQRGFNGTWKKQVGESIHPDLLTIEATRERLTFRSFDTLGLKSGLVTETLRCDGVEHATSGMSELKFDFSYRATCGERTLEIINYQRQVDRKYTFIQHWTVSEDGKQLTQRFENSKETVTYRRPSFLQRLMNGTP